MYKETMKVLEDENNICPIDNNKIFFTGKYIMTM
ncbi:Uncharacterised protein [Clostridioides difficile]|nr:hypothetical protein V440_05845 [Clostridioides difficile]CCL19602.1 hypothetical protein BN171_3290015 [Clostridioides difficile E25]SJO16913.1 Uncharacterised protein [Clostridioides difficile]SJO23327.1 Uncharacterised protein [Clostridioides difficile]SJO34214.1 Uncharacterised protein [Clostridioides difficile]